MVQEQSQHRLMGSTLMRWLEDAIRDVRYGFSRLIKKPVLALALVITLGLSIGVNIAAFSIADKLLVRGLPYRDADQLVLVSRLPLSSFRKSPAAFKDWKSETDLISDAVLYAVGEATVLGGPEPQQLHVAHVTSNIFEVLGVDPRGRRGFVPEEETQGRTNVVMISERLWRSQFGGESSVYEKEITLNNEQYKVIGVVPASCDFPAGADLWTPTAHSARAWVKSRAVASTVLARMKPGATLAQVDAQQRAWLEGKSLNKDLDRADLVPIAQSLKVLLIGELKQPILLLLGAVTLVLLIGCANVANLIMADSVFRDHEFSVRRAVGMGTGRFVRQLMTEHVLIGVIGGLVGLVAAYWSLPYLKTYLPEEWPKFADLSIDARVFVFAFGISILVGVTVGFAPYWRSAKRLDDIASGLGRRSTEPRSRRRWREILVCAESGLALVLLVTAALFIQTLRNLLETDYGFRPTNVLSASTPRQNSNDRELSVNRTFYNAVLDRLGSIPGVESIGAVDSLPARQAFAFVEQARPIPEQTDFVPAQVITRVTTPGYFRAMAIPVLDGREFDELDDQGHEPVVIVDRTLSEKLWGGQTAVGQKLSLGSGAAANVVGVVGPIRVFGPNSESLPEVYSPVAQSAPPPLLSFVLRTTTRPEAMGAQVRSVIREIDPKQPVDIATMDSYVARNLQRQRGIAGLLAVLSSLGLVLAIVGVYGLVSYSVASRTREFGIRIALGESPKRIFFRSISSGMRGVLPGVALGVVLSLATHRILKSQLFGVTPTDFRTLAAVAILLAFVGMVASIVAARRATSVDPITVLREQ